MSSPLTIDFDKLLVPISADNPSGESLRYDGTYDSIREARRADDELAQGEWVRETKTSDWPAVIDLASEALATRSKDLQIAVWLVEALVNRYGFVGLRDGLRLLRELQEQFWESLYPEMEEEEDIEFRVAPLEWLNDKLPAAVMQLPVTRGLGGEAYSWSRWQESRMVDNLGRRDQAAKQAAVDDGKITGEQFDKAMQSTPVEFYQTLFEDLEQIQEEYQNLDQIIDDKFGRHGPSLLNLKKVIEDHQTLITDLLRKRGGLRAEPPAAAAAQAQMPSASQAGVPAAAPVATAASGLPLEPRDRTDALHRLIAVAEYFRRTEPHSPVSYLVQRAVRWGDMPLDEWLPQVIHDTSALDKVRETLGLQDVPDSGNPTDEAESSGSKEDNW